MDRRTFLTSSCSICLLTGVGILDSSCATVPVFSTSIKGDRIEIPARLFLDRPLQIVHVEGFAYEIAVERKEDKYRAFVLQCTHAENPLTFTGNRFVCSLHGSTFDTNGGVTKGPADRPLKELKTQISGSTIEVVLNS